MECEVVKRSLVINRRKTSVTLEDPFWTSLNEIAGSRDMTVSQLIATIDTERRQSNLSSAIRLFVLGYHRSQLTEHKNGGMRSTNMGEAPRPIDN